MNKIKQKFSNMYHVSLDFFDKYPEKLKEFFANNKHQIKSNKDVDKENLKILSKW